MVNIYLTDKYYHLYQDTQLELDNIRTDSTNYVHMLDDRDPQINEETKNEELKLALVRNKGYWDSYGYSSYNFTLQIGIGGETDSQELGKIGIFISEKIITFQIQVMNNEIKEIKQLVGNEYVPVALNENVYFHSVTQLFTIIQDTLDQKINQDVSAILETLVPYMVSPDGTYSPVGFFGDEKSLGTLPVQVYAAFGGWGYPEFIRLFVTVDTIRTGSSIVSLYSNKKNILLLRITQFALVN
jgi:hypothetical protein